MPDDKLERLARAVEVFDAGQRLVLDRWPGLVKSDYQKAFEIFEQSRDLFRELGDEPEAGAADIWAAQMLPDVSKIGESERRLNAIIADAERRNYKVLLPPAYYWLGIGDYGRGDLSRMNRNYKTALRLAEETENDFEVGHALDSLALYYSDLGELEPALAYAGKVFSGADSDYRNPRQIWREHGTLARIALKLDLRATSLSFEKERLGIVRENWPDSILLMNASLRNIVDASDSKSDFEGVLRYAGESLRLALARGDKPENARATADLYLSLADLKRRADDCAAALADYDRALELYGRLPEVSANSYQLHKGRLLCFRRLGRRADFESERNAVLKLSEEYRASIREDSSRQAFFENEQDVFDAAAADALESQNARDAFSYVEESRARSLLEFVESDKSIAEVVADFASIARPLSLGEIQSGLPEQVQLVQYAVLPDRVAVWVLTKTRFELVEQKISAEEVEKKIEDYRAAVIAKDSGERFTRAARELYDLLIPKGLDASKQLCVVPDKSLHRLPFASLVSPSGKYLLEEFALSYAPSASVLVHATENARRRASADENVLSVGDPDFDREEYPNLSGLQSAADEAKSVARLYTRPLELVGAGATKDAFLRDFTGAQVIHFAGHFISNRRSPANSKLLFAGGDLRSSELGEHKLPRAKLVVLSACETGVERYDKSEGAIGVARTFLALGAPVVVASGWKVDSEQTRDLMVAFHHNRREAGLTSAESLRRAQLELLGRRETKEPFYWAAFSLFGGYASY